MKNAITKHASCIVLALLLTLCFDAYSQKAIIWKGGTPGRKNDWFCAQNWSTTAVPDEFSNVIIPDVSTSTFAPPILSSGKVEVNAVLIQNGGILTISREATLIVVDTVEGLRKDNFVGGGNLVLEKEQTQGDNIMIVRGNE